MLVLTIVWWLGMTMPALQDGDEARTGVVIFQSLLVGDCLLLLALALRSKFSTTAAPYTPLWQPSQRGEQEQVIGYRGGLLLVILVAAVLRFYRLNTDLWMDEVFTLVDSVRRPLWLIFSTYTDDNQHTLLSILANIVIGFAGEHAWALRLPAAIFGIASIWAVARLAELVFGQRVALFSAVLLTLSWHHIWFSQNARGYTILLFATVFSLEMMLRGLQTGRWRYWLLYAVAIAVGAWAHLTGVFIAVAHGLVLVGFFIWRRQLFLRSSWQPLLALVLSAWLTLHCYGLALPDIVNFYLYVDDSASWDVEWTSPVWLITEVLARLGLHGAVAWGAIIVGLPVGLLCAWYLWRRDRWFFALGVAPAVLIIVVMLALGRNLWPRMFFNEAGYVVISVVALTVAMGEWMGARLFAGQGRGLAPRLSAAAIPVILILVSLKSLPGLYRYPKQSYTAARDFVMAEAAEGDRILGLHMAGRVYSFYYAPKMTYVNTPEEIAVDPGSHGTTWVLYTLPGFINGAMPELAEILNSQYEIVREFPGTLGDGEIVVARSKSDSAGDD